MFYFEERVREIHATRLKHTIPGADVYWQQSVWADTKLNLDWIQNTLKSGNFSDNRKEFVLFCDSLSSQVIDEFLEALKIINRIV